MLRLHRETTLWRTVCCRRVPTPYVVIREAGFQLERTNEQLRTIHLYELYMQVGMLRSSCVDRWHARYASAIRSGLCAFRARQQNNSSVITLHVVGRQAPGMRVARRIAKRHLGVFQLQCRAAAYEFVPCALERR